MKPSDDDDMRASLEWLKREVQDTAAMAHKAMWYSAIAMVCGIVLVLKAGGFLG